jgi:hypothetical protein
VCVCECVSVRLPFWRVHFTAVHFTCTQSAAGVWVADVSLLGATVVSKSHTVPLQWIITPIATVTPSSFVGGGRGETGQCVLPVPSHCHSLISPPTLSLSPHRHERSVGGFQHTSICHVHPSAACVPGVLCCAGGGEGSGTGHTKKHSISDAVMISLSHSLTLSPCFSLCISTLFPLPCL